MQKWHHVSSLRILRRLAQQTKTRARACARTNERARAMYVIQFWHHPLAGRWMIYRKLDDAGKNMQKKSRGKTASKFAAKQRA